MNMHPLLLVSALACSAVSSFALADSSPVKPVPYHYGMPLHVEKVISMTEPATWDCKVITAQMTFIDNVGKQEAITYQKLSDACSYQN